jgi:hypothetical protein
LPKPAAFALTAARPPLLPPAQKGKDRGWVLKGVEEVSLLLEDLGLNLQVQGGSRGWVRLEGRVARANRCSTIAPRLAAERTHPLARRPPACPPPPAPPLRVSP